MHEECQEVRSVARRGVSRAKGLRRPALVLHVPRFIPQVGVGAGSTRAALRCSSPPASSSAAPGTVSRRAH